MTNNGKNDENSIWIERRIFVAKSKAENKSLKAKKKILKPLILNYFKIPE
tara:strand:+ start:550 stop:699 length:150 start_codon:yes stop_codon:yes gene_type:complete